MNFALALVYSILSTIGFSLVGIYFGKVIQRYGPFWTTFWMQVLGLPLTLILTPLFGLHLSVNVYLLYLAVFGLSAPMMLMIYGKALSIGPPAVVQAIGGIGNLITFILAVLFLGESVGVTQIVGSIVLLAGAVLVSLDIDQLLKKHVSLLTPAVPLAFLFSLIGGVLFFLLGIGIKHFDGFSASVATRIFCVPVYLLLSLRQKRSDVPMLQSAWKVLLFIAGADVVSYILFNISVQMYQVSFSAMMQSLVPVVTAIASFFLFKEKLHKGQIVGIFLAVIGAIVMSAG